MTSIVVTQISAASKALDQAGFHLVASGLTYCVAHPEQAASEGYDIDDVQTMFMKLAYAKGRVICWLPALPSDWPGRPTTG